MKEITDKNTGLLPNDIKEIIAKGLVPLKIRHVYTNATSLFNISVFHESMPRGSEVPEMVHSRTNEFVYVIRGEVAGFLSGKEILLRKGDFMMIPAGTPHRLQTGGRGMEAVSIFSPPIDPANPDATVVSKRGKKA